MPKSAIKVSPCGHQLCIPCLEGMARRSIEDPTLIPLSCCQKKLPVECVQVAFSMFSSEEYNIYQRHLAGYRKCWKSSELLSDAEYAHAVSAIGGKQCPGCGIGMERDFGCVHMQCVNGHEFCFTCLAKWGTCNCELIPEDEIRHILGE